ncbi:uncharacterized protein SEPMUDRAFT_41197 [Sphaerulina musiva SO2202]|uniref:Distal membrane-arm assembly complex protein 1-like domain-containing protein n=1 Tax=Sphaerulina musiva (strain SO2202) TaxID=692275 RepID=M3B4G7_SPHMS|nr:uncharacterized protein SEPMUDRAFT_41197 [Sphaerulina musiva SO2202]EMF14702.1 hypothetical protein SEPMUDRAFT_41197 [Sphaerulina musiva SO2202]
MPSSSTDLPLTSEPPLSETLKHQRQDFDCTSCRIMGSTVFVSLGAYTYYSGMKQLREQSGTIIRSGSRFGVFPRKVAVVGTSVVCAGLGMWRLVN